MRVLIDAVQSGGAPVVEVIGRSFIFIAAIDALLLPRIDLRPREAHGHALDVEQRLPGPVEGRRNGEVLLRRRRGYSLFSSRISALRPGEAAFAQTSRLRWCTSSRESELRALHSGFLLGSM